MSAWNIEAAADQLAEIGLLADAPRDWLLAEARAIVEAAFACPHDDAGEGDWCYSCWTNIKTGIMDWGDFGGEDSKPERCDECEAKPWEAAWRLRECLGYLILKWNCENLADVLRLLEDEGVMQACVRSVWGSGEFEES